MQFKHHKSLYMYMLLHTCMYIRNILVASTLKYNHHYKVTNTRSSLDQEIKSTKYIQSNLQLRNRQVVYHRILLNFARGLSSPLIV